MARPKRSRQPTRQRLDKQRDRQQAYRDELKEGKKPSRDDVARVLLHWMFTRSLKSPKRKEQLNDMLGRVHDLLQKQGFNDQAINDRINKLLDQYASGWEFRRKTHLSDDPNLDVDDLIDASWGALAVEARDG